MNIVKNHTQTAASYPIHSPAAKKCRQKVPPRLPVCVFYYPGSKLLKKKLKRLLSERGDSSYISNFVYILVAVVLITLIINVFHIISIKQEIDYMADQLVKQIQLNDGTSGETNALFSFFSRQLDEVEGLSYQVSGFGNTSRIPSIRIK